MGVVERGGKLYGVSLGALAGGAVGHQPAARDEMPFAQSGGDHPPSDPPSLVAPKADPPWTPLGL